MRPLVAATLLLAALLAGCAEEPTAPTPSTGSPTPITTPMTPTATTTPTTSTGAKECTSSSGEHAAEPTWVLETTMGTIRITLFCDKTPITGQHFVDLAEKGYFDGTRFHRVITDFMNQGGDPLSKDDSKKSQWGTGGPTDENGNEITIVDEFYCADGTVSYNHPAQCASGLGLKHDTPGTLSMANTGRAHTGGSQFFLTAVPTAWLDGKHAVFGHTTDEESLNVALAINDEGSQGGTPKTLVTITRSTIVWS